jgi:hypothetical protein
MRTSRWFGWGLVALGAVVGTTALLGPWGLDVIHYRTSPTTLNQVVGGDAAAFLVVAPVTVLVGVLALRRHPAAPVLALAPSLFVTYTYTQLIVGEEYLRLPGNNERFFPLLLVGFVLAGASAITAWRSAAPEELPPMSRRLARVMAVVLGVVAVYLVVGLHLSSLVDAWRDHPLRTEYVSSPTPFWLVKLMDLGILVPVAAVAAVGLWRGAAWAAKPAYAIIGGYTLLAASVAGMAITMYANSDPDSSLAAVAAFVTFTLAFAALSVALYRPLFGRCVELSTGGPSQKGDNDERELSGATRRPAR